MVSIILPWVRLDGFQRCVTSIAINSGDVKFELVEEEDIDRIGCNPMVNRLVERCNYDIICFMHDDSEPQPKFLVEALKEMAKFDGGWGCVGFNDLQHGPDGPPTHWMIHKKMLRYFPDGVFYSLDYIHTRVDRELKDISEEVGRYRWAKNAKVIHHSRVNRIKYMDELSRRCYGKANVEHDRRVYDERRAARQNNA